MSPITVGSISLKSSNSGIATDDSTVSMRTSSSSSNVPCEVEDCKAEATKIERLMNDVISTCGENKKLNWCKENFEVYQCLGEGKFGHVFLAEDKVTHYLVALKTLSKTELLKMKIQYQVVREIEVQCHLDHPNILKLLTYFSDKNSIHLVLEYAAKGTLYEVLNEQPNGRFSETTAARYSRQVADALEYCHSKHIIHRDIKPENLLLSVFDEVKLADFGWSVHAPSDKRKTFCGTLVYLPPEIVRKQAYNSKVDNWCLGILCYELQTGRTPFEGKSQSETLRRILNMEISFPKYLSTGSIEFISSLLVRRPQDRIELSQALLHPWLAVSLPEPTESRLT